MIIIIIIILLLLLLLLLLLFVCACHDRNLCTHILVYADLPRPSLESSFVPYCKKKQLKKQPEKKNIRKYLGYYELTIDYLSMLLAW